MDKNARTTVKNDLDELQMKYKGITNVLFKHVKDYMVHRDL